VKKVKFFSLFSLLLIVIFTNLYSVETKFSAEFWSRYTADFSENQLVKSYFSLERGYIGLQPTFTDKIKGRFTIDLFSSDKFEDGAGIKLKYAYVDFKMPVNDMSLQAGLIKTYFGTIYDWNYATIEKSFDDKEKIVSSADYGLSMNGLIPSGFGEYALSIYNGEGYSKTGSDIDGNPALSLNLRIIPIVGITLGGSVLYENHSLIVKADSSLTDTVRLCYSGMGRISFGLIDIWGLYVAKNKDQETGAGFMIMPVLKLSKIANFIDMEIVGRYDMFDKNIDSAELNDSHNRIMAGFNWNILKDSKSGNPVIFLQTDWERTSYEDTTKAYVDNLSLQLRYLFSGKIK